jgi:cytochrome d ubiquinol oxidase subunit I
MAFGVITTEIDTSRNYLKDIEIKFEIPNVLSYMAYLDPHAFVPGINDLVNGNQEHHILPAAEKIERGKIARSTLREFKAAKKRGDTKTYHLLKAKFEDPSFKENYFKYFGYGFLNHPNSLIPNVPLSFYSFHIMVLFGFFFILLFFLVIRFIYTGSIVRRRKFLMLLLFSIPLPYIAGQAGWIVAEAGRQPWVIQDYLPTMAAVSNIDASAVQTTFWLFFIVFTALLIAEIRIMTKQIKIGPKEGGK